jgi:hypothetical protein
MPTCQKNRYRHYDSTSGERQLKPYILVCNDLSGWDIPPLPFLRSPASWDRNRALPASHFCNSN